MRSQNEIYERRNTMSWRTSGFRHRPSEDWGIILRDNNREKRHGTTAGFQQVPQQFPFTTLEPPGDPVMYYVRQRRERLQVGQKKRTRNDGLAPPPTRPDRPRTQFAVAHSHRRGDGLVIAESSMSTSASRQAGCGRDVQQTPPHLFNLLKAQSSRHRPRPSKTFVAAAVMLAALPSRLSARSSAEASAILGSNPPGRCASMRPQARASLLRCWGADLDVSEAFVPVTAFASSDHAPRLSDPAWRLTPP